MRHYKRMILLFRLAPFRAWKAGLLRRHIERCPDCERRLASREEARRVLVQVHDVGDLDRFWPAIARRIRGIRPSPVPDAGLAREGIRSPLGFAWRAAAATAGLALAALMTLALIRFLQPPPPSAAIARSESDQVQIHYVRIDNEPARTFIFKPHDSDVVIVWAGKNI